LRRWQGWVASDALSVGKVRGIKIGMFAASVNMAGFDEG